MGGCKGEKMFLQWSHENTFTIIGEKVLLQQYEQKKIGQQTLKQYSTQLHTSSPIPLAHKKLMSILSLRLSFSALVLTREHETKPSWLICLGSQLMTWAPLSQCYRKSQHTRLAHRHLLLLFILGS